MRKRFRVTLTQEGYDCMMRAFALANQKPFVARKLRNGKIEIWADLPESYYENLCQLRDTRRTHGCPKATISDIFDEAMRIGWIQKNQKAIVKATRLVDMNPAFPYPEARILDLECGHIAFTPWLPEGVTTAVCSQCAGMDARAIWPWIWPWMPAPTGEIKI